MNLDQELANIEKNHAEIKQRIGQLEHELHNLSFQLAGLDGARALCMHLIEDQHEEIQ